MTESSPRASAARPPRRKPFSAITRYGIVPLLLLAIGIRVGMYIQQGRMPAPAPTLPPAPAAPALEAAAEPTPGPAARPTCELAGSFDSNIYPSLLLSFAAAYPEYARCLTATLRNLPASASCQLRIDSVLFLRPLQVSVQANGGSATVSPELPWNFDALRRTTQMGPQTFVATILVDGQTAAEASLLCTVHSVNEAVSRIYNGSTAQWQDTSVCFAAFVNEDHPWINALLQEAVASGSIRAFTGYQGGPQSILLQAQAVWDALAARGLNYVNVATDSGTSPFVSTQYVRFLDQSVRDQGANCVDASVLFASILRRIGLRPVLFFRPGHCFTGFYDASEGGRLVAFETTMLGSAPFAAAAAEGAKELQSTLPFIGTPQYSIVDVALCRQQGINPIPYQAPDRT
ncbi:MAG TPA: hypothetical protein VGG37_06480 [Opitutaceae bacterium]|jgi:hypothetical protein